MAGNLPKEGLIVEDCDHFEPYTGKFLSVLFISSAGFWKNI